MTRIPTVIGTSDLPLAELHAARLDGELYSVDECFTPVDSPGSCSMRALALAGRIPAGLIAERHSAAWIWGALDQPPVVIEVCADIRARLRPARAARLHIREVVISATETTRIGTVLVTTPLRTLLDLARFDGVESPVEIECAERLIHVGGITRPVCDAWLARHANLPGKRRARAVIARMLPAAAG